jgi:hypothetical protein
MDGTIDTRELTEYPSAAWRVIALAKDVLVSPTEAAMKPLQIVLGLASIALLCTGTLATYNFLNPGADRVGPDWFQAFSMYGGTAMLLVGVVVAVAAAQASVGRSEVAKPRGLRLGRTTLGVGTVLLMVGLAWPVLTFMGLMPSALLVVSATASWMLSPILMAVGGVLLGRSAVAVRREVSHPLRMLALGKATLWTGFVLLLLGWSLLTVLPSVNQGLGLIGLVIWMECFPAGLALLVVGALINAAEPSPRGDPKATRRHE